MKTVSAFAAMIVIGFWIIVILAGFVMICIGAAHSANPQIPALGLEATWWLTIAIVALVNTARVSYS